MPKIELTDLQEDAITELLNIGMGQAAAALSAMVNEEVKLAIPRVELLSRQQASAQIDKSQQQLISGIKQHFKGSFEGDALLLFPQRKSLELVRALMKDDVPLEILTELEQDALLEIGNIILNASLSSFANLLGHEVVSSLPLFVAGRVIALLDTQANDEEDIVLFLHMDFSLQSRDIQGYVAFVLEVTSVEQFIYCIDKYLQKHL